MGSPVTKRAKVVGEDQSTLSARLIDALHLYVSMEQLNTYWPCQLLP